MVREMPETTKNVQLSPEAQQAVTYAKELSQLYARERERRRQLQKEAEQSKKYAQELSQLYTRERQERRELEKARRLLENRVRELEALNRLNARILNERVQLLEDLQNRSEALGRLISLLPKSAQELTPANLLGPLVEALAPLSLYLQVSAATLDQGKLGSVHTVNTDKSVLEGLDFQELANAVTSSSQGYLLFTEEQKQLIPLELQMAGAQELAILPLRSAGELKALILLLCQQEKALEDCLPFFRAVTGLLENLLGLSTGVIGPQPQPGSPGPVPAADAYLGRLQELLKGLPAGLKQDGLLTQFLRLSQLNDQCQPAIALFDDDSSPSQVYSSWPAFPQAEPALQEWLRESELVEAIKYSSPSSVCDESLVPLSPTLSSQGIKSYAALPIGDGGQPAGVWMVFSKKRPALAREQMAMAQGLTALLGNMLVYSQWCERVTGTLSAAPESPRQQPREAPPATAAAPLAAPPPPEPVYQPVAVPSTSSAQELASLLLQQTVSSGSSDLHLKIGSHPLLRLHGELSAVTEAPVLTAELMQGTLEAVTSPQQRERFTEAKELDFSYLDPSGSRFRANVCYQRGSISISFRPIPSRIPAWSTLGIPEVVKEFVKQRQGLMLVTGPTGSGKSTTLAALIDYLNNNFSRRIVTIEDPIEFVHTDRRSQIIQREVGSDTFSFTEGLRRALRQDPDVILIGEMRDLETVTAAITAAETGHIVLGTLHTMSAAQTIDRIIDVFPGGQQPQIRTQLSMTLNGCISQRLLRRSDKPGRIAAFEVMVGTGAIRNLIREAKIHEIPSYIELGSKAGMNLLEQSLFQLIQDGVIDRDEAREAATERGYLDKLLDELDKGRIQLDDPSLLSSTDS